jgi:hypothetical protein
VFVFFRMLSPPFLLSFSGFYSQRMPPLPGNKVTVIAGVMAMHRWPSVFFRSGEEDEQCWWPFAFRSLTFWRFCNQAPWINFNWPLDFSTIYIMVLRLQFLAVLTQISPKL